MTEAVFSPGNPLDIYEMGDCLGTGAYGSVYKALNRETHEEVAVKRMEFADTDDIVDVLREIVVLQECHHERCVRYIGSWRESPTCIWIVMELCEFGSIVTTYELTKHGLNEEQLSFVLRCILEGLIYLHGSKRIHRDIKAGNILVKGDGDIRIGDFGVSATIARTVDKRKTSIGSPYWMAPEVIQNQPYDFHADIWSLGITAIEMLDGRAPLSDLHPYRAIFQIPKNPPPKPRQPEKHSELLLDFLTRCLQKEQENREPAHQLIKHEFITKYKDTTSIVLNPLLQDVRVGMIRQKEERESLAKKLAAAQLSAEMNAKKKKEESGLQKDDEEDDEDDEQDEGDESTMVFTGDEMRKNVEIGKTLYMSKEKLEKLKDPE